MAESSLPVDLTNPGQVFACLGILELAEVLSGDAKGAFDWNMEQQTKFRVAAADPEPPIARIMRFLQVARIVVRAPSNSPSVNGWKANWGTEPVVIDRGAPFPFPDPGKPAKLPVTLIDDEGNEVELDHWGDVTRRDAVKFWAGMAGKPAVAIIRDAIEIARERMRHIGDDPLAFSGIQTSSFRFDWRRDYIPVQEGFSPNNHRSTIQMIGFPLVEILAAVGMSNARPYRKEALEYRYGVLGCDDGRLLPLVFHRAALGAEYSPIPGRSFRRFAMQLDWPGKSGQARCITLVSEEEDT